MGVWAQAGELTPDSVNLVLEAPAVVRDLSVPIPIKIGVANAGEDEIAIEEITIEFPGLPHEPIQVDIDSSAIAPVEILDPDGIEQLEEPELAHYQTAIEQGMFRQSVQVACMQEIAEGIAPGETAEGLARLRIKGTGELLTKPFKVTAEEPLPTVESWVPGDGHVHTEYSDGKWSDVDEQTQRAKLVGLRWIGLVDHGHEMDSDGFRDQGEKARAAFDKHGLTVLQGQEIGVEEHLLAYDIRGDFSYDKMVRADGLVDMVDRVDGIGCIAHPSGGWFGRYRWKDSAAMDKVAGLEVLRGAWHTGDADDFALKLLDREMARRASCETRPRGIAVMAGSDAHFWGQMGLHATYVLADMNGDHTRNQEALHQSLRSGRTVASKQHLVVFRVTAGKAQASIGDVMHLVEPCEVDVEVRWWPSTYRPGTITVVESSLGGGVRPHSEHVEYPETREQSKTIRVMIHESCGLRVEARGPDAHMAFASPAYVLV